MPTFAELGHPDLTKDEWFGMLLPPGASPAAVATLLDAIRRAAADPALRDALAKLEFDATTSDSPAAFAEKIRRERQDWAAVVKESGVVMED